MKRERETERQTDRQTERERQREMVHTKTTSRLIFPLTAVSKATLYIYPSERCKICVCVGCTGKWKDTVNEKYAT